MDVNNYYKYIYNNVYINSLYIFDKILREALENENVRCKM